MHPKIVGLKFRNEPEAGFLLGLGAHSVAREHWTGLRRLGSTGHILLPLDVSCLVMGLALDNVINSF